MFDLFSKIYVDSPGVTLIRYTPQEDITAYEVSKCLEIVVMFNWNRGLTYETSKNFILSYPENVRRHFKFDK